LREAAKVCGDIDTNHEQVANMMIVLFDQL